MLEFLTLKPEAFGLDISDLSIKTVKFEKKRKILSLSSFAETSIKPGIIRQGEIKDEKSLVKIIKKSLAEVKGKPLKTKYVIASLPEEKAFLQVIQMPHLSKEDLKSAVIYEAENYIPLPIEEVYLDFQIVPPFQNHLDHFDVLITALPKKTVDPYLSCLKKAGLKPLALEIESLSIVRTLIKDEVAASPILIIDLGATRTGLIVFSGHSLRFTSSIPISSQKFTEAISQIMKIDLNKAEKLKLKYGLIAKEAKEGGNVFEALVPPLTDLTEQIKKYLEYYQTHAFHEHLAEKSKKVEKILLCGGGANLKGLTDFFSNRLELSVELGNPWVNILPSSWQSTSQPKKETSGISFEKSLSYATALGLALRSTRSKPGI